MQPVEERMWSLQKLQLDLTLQETHRFKLTLNLTHRKPPGTQTSPEAVSSRHYVRKWGTHHPSIHFG